MRLDPPSDGPRSDAPATPRPCKVCGKLTTSPVRRPILGPSTKPKRLCAACASDFDRRRSRRSRAIRFLVLATLAALLAVAGLLGASALAIGPPTSETAWIAAVVVAIPYLLAIRRRFGLGMLS